MREKLQHRNDEACCSFFLSLAHLLPVSGGRHPNSDLRNSIDDVWSADISGRPIRQIGAPDALVRLDPDASGTRSICKQATKTRTTTTMTTITTTTTVPVVPGDPQKKNGSPRGATRRRKNGPAFLRFITPTVAASRPQTRTRVIHIA